MATYCTDRRSLMGGLVGLGAIAMAANGRAQEAKPGEVVVKANPPQLSRIAISPDGKKVAYVTGRAADQKLLYFTLEDMKPQIFDLGSVFLTEMMWGSNTHVLIHVRYFRKLTRKDQPSYLQIGYVWRVLDLSVKEKRPYLINADLSDMNRVQANGVFGLVYQNKIGFQASSSSPQLSNDTGIPGETQATSSELQLWANEDYVVGGVSLLSDQVGSTPKPYDEFNLIDIASKADTKLVSLDVTAASYALTSDGRLAGFSSFSRDDRRTEIYIRKERDAGRKPFKVVMTSKAETARSVSVVGLGLTDEALLVAKSTDTSTQYFELDAAGKLTPFANAGKPVFDSYSHRLVGFGPVDADGQWNFLDSKWAKVWAGLLSMVPQGASLKIESQAQDCRKLIVSIKESSGSILYYFIDLSTGQNELLTRNAAPGEVAASPAK